MLRSKSAESEGVTTLSENSQIAESREANSSINIGREGGLSIIVKIVTVKITSFCIYIYRHLENGKKIAEHKGFSSLNHHNHKQNNNHL